LALAESRVSFAEIKTARTVVDAFASGLWNVGGLA
jgi:hypothetical protein